MVSLQYESNEKWVAFDTYSEYIFLVDFILGFFTSYLDHHIGAEITQPSYIACHYLGGGFLIDFLSLVPLWLTPVLSTLGIHHPNMMNLFRMTKIVRVRRLSKLIQVVNINKEIKNQLKRIMVVLYLVIICHIQGCLLYYIFMK